MLAERQTAGRGRRGRAWDSPEGNLALSVIVDGGAKAAAPGLLSLATAIAVAQACETFAVDVALKWPNDLMVEGAKLGGILIEAAGSDRYVVGLGINIRARPTIEGRPTISLADVCGVARCPDVDVFLAVLVPLLMRWADRWTAGESRAIREAWLAHAVGLGQTITLMNGNERISGVFLGVAEDGALRLDANGSQRAFHAGEVSLGAG